MHIIVSTLLSNTSIDGNIYRTLLPLDSTDILALRNLSTAIRNGLNCKFYTPPIPSCLCINHSSVVEDRLVTHISTFGLCKARNRGPEHPERKRYHAFFETLLEPFFKSNSAEDVAPRKADMDEVISASVAHGMKVLAFAPEVEYRWGEKKEGLDGEVRTTPAMCMLTFEHGKYLGHQEMVKAAGL
jgi:hypothetical protein